MQRRDKQPLATPARRRLAGVLLALALASGVSYAADAKRQCLRSCRPALRTCLRDARVNAQGSAAACTGDRAIRRSCRRTAQRIGKAGRANCRAFRTACRTCCQSGGTDCARPPETPVFSGTFVVPDRRGLDALPLPLAPDGRSLVLAALPDGILAFDPTARGPVSAAAECAAVMLACFHAPERNWAGCFAGVPPCTTDTPWTNDGPMCCAPDCGARYQTLRRTGLVGPSSFAAAIWEAPSCMPGVVGHVEPAP